MDAKLLLLSKFSSLLLMSTLTTSCVQDKPHRKAYQWPQANAPIAASKPHTRLLHGDTVADPYYWLNDYFKKGPDSTAVIEYLEAENAYTDSLMKATETLQVRLFDEMKGRIKEQDESVPYFKNGYYYYTR